jgi:hypothetical protein
MCLKGQRRCEYRHALEDDAYREWEGAEELEDVRRAWARLGGRTTLHRYGREHFSLLARHRWGSAAAAAELAATPTWRGQCVLVVGKNAGTGSHEVRSCSCDAGRTYESGVPSGRWITCPTCAGAGEMRVYVYASASPTTRTNLEALGATL